MALSVEEIDPTPDDSRSGLTGAQQVRQRVIKGCMGKSLSAVLLL